MSEQHQMYFEISWGELGDLQINLKVFVFMCPIIS